MSIERLVTERAQCYQLARQINEKRVILNRALCLRGPRTGFHEVLSQDFDDLTLQLQNVLDRSRRLTLQIIFQKSFD